MTTENAQEQVAHEVRFAPRDNHPYRVECSCGWDASSFSHNASPARNVANVRRTGQAHVRAATRKAKARDGTRYCGLTRCMPPW